MMKMYNGSPGSRIKIGIAQYEIDSANPDTNIAYIEHCLGQDKPDILILPEMGITGYLLDEIHKHLDKTSSYISRLSGLAKKYRAAICTTLPYRDGGKVFNRLFFLTEEHIHTYDKMYLIDWGGFQESKYFHEGSEIKVVDYHGWIVGFSVCYDLRFPELYVAMNSYAYQVFNNFVDVFLLPSQWPHSRIEHFLTLSKARAIENIAYFVAVNSTGKIGELESGGNSRVWNPDGHEILSCDTRQSYSTVILDKEILRSARAGRPLLHYRHKKGFTATIKIT